MAFCKDFNARTQGIKVRTTHSVRLKGTVQSAGNRKALFDHLWNQSLSLSCAMPCVLLHLMQDDVPLPVLVTAYKDKTFEFVRAQVPGSCRCRSRPRLSHAATCAFA